jgi:hypothetical protein
MQDKHGGNQDASTMVELTKLWLVMLSANNATRILDLLASGVKPNSRRRTVE